MRRTDDDQIDPLEVADGRTPKLKKFARPNIQEFLFSSY